jgi:large subunit ribosomal protein L5
MKDNKIREIEIEKVVLAIGALGEALEKAVKLLNIISGMKVTKTKARKRIPAFGIRPGLEIGCKVTMRGEKAEEILKKGIYRDPRSRISKGYRNDWSERDCCFQEKREESRD